MSIVFLFGHGSLLPQDDKRSSLIIVIDVLQIYYEPIQSGQTTHVLSLACELHQRGYRVTVALPSHLKSSQLAFQQEGIKIIPLTMRKFYWSPSALHTLVRLVHQFSVIHIHSQEAGLVARPVAYLAGARAVVYTPQTIDIRQKRYQVVYQQVEKVLGSITDRIISVNDVDRIRLIRWGIPADKVITIPNGIDLSKFNERVNLESTRQLLGVDGERPIVMQIGRLSDQKDPAKFVEGAAQVAKFIPAAQFVLLGEGPLRDTLSAQIQVFGLEESIHLVGYQGNAWKYIPVASVVTLTSRWEGMPYSLMEAMGWAKPVVATEVNGVTELVRHGESGFLVELGDISAWAEYVSYLLENPQKAKEMGCKGQSELKSRLSLNSMVDQVEGLYNELIN